MEEKRDIEYRERAVEYHKNRCEEKKCKKPPIGIRPRSIHDQERAVSILDTMKIYITSHNKIPTEWFEELIDLCGDEDATF